MIEIKIVTEKVICVNDKIVIELDRVQAGNLSWLLMEQVKSLKKLQREECDAMQPVIDDFQNIADMLLELLEKG